MLKRDPKSTTLGILGGGQLGMFLAQKAQELGFTVHLYIESDSEVPARAFAHQVFIGNGLFDQEKLAGFVSSCDVVVLENEFVPVELLRSLPQTPFVPDLDSYEIFQNKYLEKQLALKAGIKVADFSLVQSLEDVQAKTHEWGKLVLKTCRGGYDGTGNLTVNPGTSPDQIVHFLSRGPCLAERWVVFTHEVAVMVVRSETQEMVFPVAETIQHGHICHQVIAPARLSSELNSRIQKSALKLIREAQGVGLFGVEFFITQEEEIFYNETAPRPHNSAHFTIEGCTLSQFEANLLVAFHSTLPEPKLISPSVGMLNLLGTEGGTNHLVPSELFENDSRGHLWLYGKKESRPGRKMGHYTLLGEKPSVILEKLTNLQQRYQL